MSYYFYRKPYYFVLQMRRCEIPMPPIPPPPPRCIGGTIYTVRPGDTLFRIANELGISLLELIMANPQIENPNIIFVGQQICIPRITLPPLPPPEPFCPEGILYTVQRGDTLFNIARRYGITVREIIQANPQIRDPNVIQTGETICIPVLEPLPDKICKINLQPQREGILGGTVMIHFQESAIWITTFGLPAPKEIGEEFQTYQAWTVDEDTGAYFEIELVDTGVPGIQAGYGKIPDGFRTFEEIVVTAEPQPLPQKPSGPVVLWGDLTICK